MNFRSLHDTFLSSSKLCLKQELSESAALAMAAKYFGLQTTPTASLVERKSEYAIDPVTPFDNMPDPDAPSKAEMMENFNREHSVMTKSEVVLDLCFYELNYIILAGFLQSRWARKKCKVRSTCYA
jgi:hypothetical protein